MQHFFTTRSVFCFFFLVGEFLKTPEHSVPDSNGFKWFVQWYPAGYVSSHANHLGVYLSVNKTISAKYSYKIHNSSIQRMSGYYFVDYKVYGFPKFVSHAALRPLFVNGQLLITFEGEFNVPVSFTRMAPRSILHSNHVSTDFALVVDSNRVHVHKSVLSLMSPVFHAMLSQDTAESRSGEVDITDFDYETVKTAIDYCYGRKIETPSVETIFDILRFADKYDVQAVTSLVEEMSQQNLEITTFPAIIRYADGFFKDDLFDECCKFFKEHQKSIVKTEKFATLSSPLVARLLKKAFDLETEFDVLRHAHTNKITFILDPLEQPILESLSLETFCNTVSYAWDCSRDTLKKACAEFFSEHLNEISNMRSFVQLSPTVIQGVMILKCDMFLADK